MSDKEESIKTDESPQTVAQEIYTFHQKSSEDPTYGDKYERLHWDIDPLSSFSDWKIDISVLEDGIEISSRTYHVHKSILAVGSRRSEYFARIFYNGDFDNVNGDCTSKVHLEKTAADIFPDLLDYLYFPERPLTLCRETVVALHYLGHHFGMQQLAKDAKQLLKRDLNLDNCAKYYKQAVLVNNVKVQKLVSRKCASNIDKIFPNSEIMQISEASMWLQVLETYPKNDYVKCCHVSRLMAAFCERYSEMDSDLLGKIVAKANLPHVPLDAGISFIQVENRLLLKGGLSSLQEQQELTGTQKRLIQDCFASRWANFGMQNKSFSTFLQQQSPLFLSELMVELIGDAQSCVMSLESEKTSMLDKMTTCGSCFDKAKEYHR